tara:strand:+ start:2461 stop:3138 length:678 start_codon:yes stop_codon:yes gene_type:complete
MSSKEKLNTIVVVKERPIFNWKHFPIGTSAKLYNGRVVKLLSVIGNVANWGYGKQSRTVAYSCVANGWGSTEKQSDDINPQTVHFPRTKTTDINMRGIPVGTLCATTLEQSEWYEFVDEIPAEKNEDEDEVKLRFRQVNPHNKDNEIVAEQIRNPKPVDKVESYQTFSRQGFGYGQAYKEQRSYGDLYVENIIFPLWEVDRKLIDKDRIEQEETFERLDSMFDFA